MFSAQCVLRKLDSVCQNPSATNDDFDRAPETVDLARGENIGGDIWRNEFGFPEIWWDEAPTEWSVTAQACAGVEHQVDLSHQSMSNIVSPLGVAICVLNYPRKIGL